MRISASRLRRLIREVAETVQTEQERSSKDAAFHSLMDRTAVYVESAKGQVRSAVIYDTEHGKHPYNLSKDDILFDVIKGVIDISKPVSKPVSRQEMPCLGAWEVISSAGPKYGKMVYGVGYALSPNGVLMPDRSSVSTSARGGWTSSFSRGETVGQLDDWENPKTPEPEDDCWVHNEDGAPYLDYAYSVGSERSMEIFRTLEANHKRYMEQLGDYDSKAFIRKLNKHSQEFFEMHT